MKKLILLFLFFCIQNGYSQKYEGNDFNLSSSYLLDNGNIGCYSNFSGVRLESDLIDSVSVTIRGRSTSGIAILKCISPGDVIKHFNIIDGETILRFYNIRQGLWNFQFVNDYDPDPPGGADDRNVEIEWIELKQLTTQTPVEKTTFTLTWNKNTEKDLKGYKVYWGSSSRNYSNNISVGIDTTYQSKKILSPGFMYFFTVTAFDTSNNESGYGNEVSKKWEIEVAPGDSIPPANPNVIGVE
jgi:hypothetical protein